MKKMYLVLIASLVLMGCQSQTSVKTEIAPADPESVAREGDTTLTGKVVKVGDGFALVDSDGKQTELDSYKIELSESIDKQVSVTGQFSGDTLFVAEIK